jgi:hypothetical protein
MLVDSTHGYHLGTFDNKNTRVGIFTRNEKEDVPSSILHMGPKKYDVPYPYHQFFKLIEQEQNIVNSTQEDRLNTFGKESTWFLFVKKKKKT